MSQPREKKGEKKFGLSGPPVSLLFPSSPALFQCARVAPSRRPSSRHAPAILACRAALPLLSSPLKATGPLSPQTLVPISPPPPLTAARALPSPSIRRLWSASSQFLAWEASPPSPRPVPLLIRPSLWPCRPFGVALRPQPPFVVAPPRRCSSPLVPPPVRLAAVCDTPCARPLPLSSPASPCRLAPSLSGLKFRNLRV